ncbi:ABC transporter G family member 39 [Medicago truncatula]|nr:ABC transporter G family member 39-like [Medicago truncatula]
MDVLSGRKTSGYLEGSISISGYPKNQATFARISGYCEQNDIHSPNITVYESLLFSAWLRLSKEVDIETRKMAYQPSRERGLPFAVELVANPSIIFMNEPTIGLDARAAAVVMRTVRNTVVTGRTVVCTIHQPILCRWQLK